jgi:hypothetical protein
VCIDGVTEPQNASIISPIDTGMIEDDEGNMIPIQQTSPATLEPKPPDRAALITKFQRLRLGKLDCIRNEAVTRQLDQWARRTEAYNKHLRRHRYEIGDLVLYQNYALKGKPGHP